MSADNAKELYPRLKPDDSAIERYRDAIDNLPPIVVARGRVPVDAYPRWQAHRREGVKTIPAEDLGDLTDTEIFNESIRRNAQHGQQLSSADKRALAGKLSRRGQAPHPLRDLPRRVELAEGAVVTDLEHLLGYPPRGRRRIPKRAADNPGPGNRPRPVIGGMPGERWRELRDVRPMPRTPETGPGADGPRPAGRWSGRIYRGFRRPSLARRARRAAS